MKETTILDKKFRESIPEEAICKRIDEIAEEMNRDFAGKNVIFLGIMNGAFMFASEIFKRINLNAQISFVKLSSYTGTQSSGVVQQIIGLDLDIKGRTIVVIEDIVDTGLTLERFRKTLSEMEPAEVMIAACLLKPDAFNNKFPIDYLCFSIPDEFVVGYGLDYDGLGRNSGDIYKIVEG